MKYKCLLLKSALCALLAFAGAGASAQMLGDMSLRKAFEPDGFDYSTANFENFSYTYEDEQGQSVTCPLTEPATTPAAMKALLREVYTNREIPGRIWVYDGDEVDYNLVAGTDRADKALAGLGIAPGDYRPYRDGLTCLLVEGIDEPFETLDFSAYDDDYSFGMIKSIRLITSRMTIGSNTIKVGGADVPSPGYLFMTRQPLYQFYYITKGKPRRLAVNKAHLPFMNLFEEYSPNDGSKEMASINAYAELREGKSFAVSHDCSSVVRNRGHIMKIQSAAGPSAVNTSLSIFIPYYRNYDDLANPGIHNHAEPYTWYDPAFCPFMYTYAIQLKAEVENSADDDNVVDVHLRWHTNFRDFFNTSLRGEFYVYKVSESGVVEGEPIKFTAAVDDKGVTTFYPEDENGFCVRSNNGEVHVIYQEDRGEVSRDISYIVGGRLEDVDKALTYSNIDRVFIPGRDDLKSFLVRLKGYGESNYIFESSTNDYVNTIDVRNPPVTAPFTGVMLDVGGIFTITRQGVAESVAPAPIRQRMPSATPTVIAYYEVISKQEKDIEPDVYVCRLLNPDGTPVEGADLVTLYANDNDIVLGGNPDDPYSLFVFDDDFDVIIPEDNSHSSSYLYNVTYTSPDDKVYTSNEESVNVFKSDLVVTPTNYSHSEMLVDEVDHEQPLSTYEALVTVNNDARVDSYLLRGARRSGEQKSPVIAQLQHSDGEYTLLTRNSSGILTPVGEPFSVDEEMFEISIPLSFEQWRERDFLGVEAILNNNLSETVHGSETNSYGSPQQSQLQAPIIGWRYLTLYNMTGYTASLVCAQIEVNLPDDGIIGSMKIDGISHFAIWRTLNGQPEEVVHNSLTPPPYTGNYWTQVNYGDPDTKEVLSYMSGFSDPGYTEQPQYTVRAYLLVSPLNEDGPMQKPRAKGRAGAPESNQRYVIIESTATPVNGGMLTGIDSIIGDGDAAGSLAVADGQLIGTGAIGIYDTAGALVTLIDDSLGARPLPKLAPGVYIASTGVESVKFVTK